MYKNRLIPKLILKRSPLNNDKIIIISTLNFKKIFSIGDPYSQTKIFNAQSADELIIPACILIFAIIVSYFCMGGPISMLDFHLKIRQCHMVSFA